MNKLGLFVVAGLAAFALIGCEQKSPAEKSMGDAVKSMEKVTDQAASEVKEAAQAVQAEAEKVGN